MDFVGGLPTNRKGHDYLFEVVDRFKKMCILMPCKKTIKGQEVANMFRCTLGYQGASFHTKLQCFSIPFGLHFGRRWTLI
jgi:hypothetical protein